MIVLPYSELAQTHMEGRVFGSGSHTEQVRRRLVPRFSWTELKELFHLEKRLWSLLSDLRGIVMVQKKRHVLLSPRGLCSYKVLGSNPTLSFIIYVTLSYGLFSLKASLFSSVK